MFQYASTQFQPASVTPIQLSLVTGDRETLTDWPYDLFFFTCDLTLCFSHIYPSSQVKLALSFNKISEENTCIATRWAEWDEENDDDDERMYIIAWLV